MFRLTAEERAKLSSSQIVMIDNLPKNRTGKYLPYAFTEHDVTMLASVLKSPKARAMNIAIVGAFAGLRKLVSKKDELIELVKTLKDRIDEHDVQLSSIYDAIENRLDDKVNEKSWENRERIGFKKT